jgi:hypothetical protein
MLLPANILHKYTALLHETVQHVLAANAKVEIEIATWRLSIRAIHETNHAGRR